MHTLEEAKRNHIRHHEADMEQQRNKKLRKKLRKTEGVWNKGKIEK